jgi:DNA-binding response OmpR family regulator
VRRESHGKQEANGVLSKVRQRKAALAAADAGHTSEYAGYTDAFVGAEDAPPVNASDGSMLLRCGSIELDRVNKRARRSGRLLRLRPKEFGLLELLILNSGTVLSREDIVKRAWHDSNDLDIRTVDVTVGRLRKAVNRGWLPDPIRSVRGQGYTFYPDPEDEGLQPEAARKLRLSRAE